MFYINFRACLTEHRVISDKIRSFGYERMYQSLHKVADTPFHIQWISALGVEC